MVSHAPPRAGSPSSLHMLWYAIGILPTAAPFLSLLATILTLKKHASSMDLWSVLTLVPHRELYLAGPICTPERVFLNLP